MDAGDPRLAASPRDVEQRLDDLWRLESSDGEAVLRACSMNLVVVCDEAAGDLQRATELVGRIAETVPGRALVVGPPRHDGGDAFDVYVSAHCHRGIGGRQVCSEQVTIETSPAKLDRVPATVLQLLVEDMPVHTLWRRGELEASPLLDSLAALSDSWILDSAASAAPRNHLRALAAFATREDWRGVVADTAWARTEVWRDAVASFFDNPAVRGALDGIVRIEVSSGGTPSRGGGTVSSAYLAGWLASRLEFRHEAGRWSRRDGGPVELSFRHRPELEAGEIGSAVIEAEHAGTRVVFDASLADRPRRSVRLTVRAGAHGLPARLIRLPDLDEAGLLCGVLQSTGRDAVFDSALTLAVCCL
jgi:glucose-6-phosphate dehydrogenase assembly protein OpcA